MPEFVTVARARDIAPGKAKEVQLNGRRVAVFNVDGEYYACDDECPHAGFSLAQGDLDGAKVVCFGHGWGFDLSSGACDMMAVDVQVYPVQIVDGDVQIAVT